MQYAKNKPHPCLLICDVILFNPYPVTFEDKDNLIDRGNRGTHGCHYVPIIYDGKGMNYTPPPPGIFVALSFLPEKLF